MAKSSKKKEAKASAKKPISEEKHSQGKASNDELSLKFDISKAKNLFQNKIVTNFIFPLFLIIIVMAVAFYVRSGPISLNGLDSKVEANVYSQIQSLIAQQVDAQYPNLNPSYKQDLVQKEYQKVIDSGTFTYGGQTVQISDIVAQNTQAIKNSFKADNGHTYLNAIDPYHFLALTDNYVKYGHLGTTLKEDANGSLVPYNEHKLAPTGVYAPKSPEFHTWVEIMFFKLFGVNENSDIGEQTAAIYLIPVIFAMLSAVGAFFILKKFTGNLFAFLGSLLLVSIGTFVSRTIAGFVDTDAYNVFFPVTIVAFLIYGFLYKDWQRTVLFGAVAGFFMGVYMWSWTAAWFIFGFIVISLIGYLFYILATELLDKIIFSGKDLKSIILNLKDETLLLVTFIVSSEFFSYLLVKRDLLISTFHGFLGGTSGNVVSISTTYIWPNVVSSVAELNNASFAQIINAVGGKLIFIIALLGLVFISLDYKARNKSFTILNRILVLVSAIWFYVIIYQNFFVKYTVNYSLIFLVALFIPVGIALLLRLINVGSIDNKVFLAMLLSIWVMGTVYMSLNGVRFIVQLAPAFAIAFGVGLYYIAKIINDFVSHEFKVKDSNVKTKAVGYVIVLMLFAILYAPIFTEANAISKGTTPNFDDAWYSTMYKINNASKSEAIITSWWDFGHFFVAVADRGVTFDGGSQETPMAHWVGRLLLEQDEEKAHDMLQMLVCGGNSAHDKMLEMVNGTNADTVKIIKIINNTFGKSNDETRQILSENKYYNFTDEQIEDIMQSLACDAPREDFLITSEDMVGKAGVWAHWGSWDFTKKYVFDNYQTKSAQQIAEDIDANVTLIESYITQLKAIDKQAQVQNIKRKDLMNQWLAPYPSYIPLQGRYEYPCVVQNETLVCQNGLTVDVNTAKIGIPKEFEGQIVFKNLVYPAANGKLSVVEQNANGDIDAIIIPTSNGNFNILLAQSPLGTSLFTKLYYLNGYGTKYFDLFDNVQGATGVRVTTWKVKWDNEITTSQLSGLNVGTVEFNATKEEVKQMLGEDANGIIQ